MMTVSQIIEANCGNPPQRKLVEYHIWVNKSKYDFYSKSPFYRGDEHTKSQNFYKELITAGEKLLKTLTYESK
jgi:hypothetical protein